ncbi:MAG: peroxiredoxin [Legionellales bacterium]|nr:MAG: peroxiredoxin [Legionellales bacterium]
MQSKPAPIFTLPATNSSTPTVSLTDFLGKYVILYFYPKDNTPGCIQEGLDFNEYLAEFNKLNTVVLGVSRDTIAAHEKFCIKQGYSFPLLSDHEDIVCRQYGVIKEKSIFGKTALGIIRSTFLINSKGEIVYSWEKVKVTGHVQKVLAQLKMLLA